MIFWERSFKWERGTAPKAHPKVICCIYWIFELHMIPTPTEWSDGRKTLAQRAPIRHSIFFFLALHGTAVTARRKHLRSGGTHVILV